MTWLHFSTFISNWETLYITISKIKLHKMLFNYYRRLKSWINCIYEETAYQLIYNMFAIKHSFWIGLFLQQIPQILHQMYKRTILWQVGFSLQRFPVISALPLNSDWLLYNSSNSVIYCIMWLIRHTRSWCYALSAKRRYVPIIRKFLTSLVPFPAMFWMEAKDVAF